MTYTLVSMLQAWWEIKNKWFSSYAMIINSLFYVFLVMFCSFLIQGFGYVLGFSIIGFFLWIRKEYGDVKFTIAIKKKEMKQNLALWCRILYLNLFNFLGYSFVKKAQIINYDILWIQMGVFVLLIISLICMLMEVKKYQNFVGNIQDTQ